MGNTLYLKRLAFTIISIVLLVFVLPPMVRECLGMFAIGWCLSQIADNFIKE